MLYLAPSTAVSASCRATSVALIGHRDLVLALDAWIRSRIRTYRKLMISKGTFPPQSRERPCPTSTGNGESYMQQALVLISRRGRVRERPTRQPWAKERREELLLLSAARALHYNLAMHKSGSRWLIFRKNQDSPPILAGVGSRRLGGCAPKRPGH